ncbi:hypothetical protein AGR9A_Lc40184 [Agrobacterium salinitolerans str. Hayward 0363]|nr:hypothetical protein AGR9A_Lc40184 [Agrobacterium salinitolerans str. Hayward 0363]
MKDKGGAIIQTGSLWAIQAIGATPSAANFGVMPWFATLP